MTFHPASKCLCTLVCDATVHYLPWAVNNYYLLKKSPFANVRHYALLRRLLFSFCPVVHYMLHDLWMSQLVSASILLTCSQAGDWENWSDWVWRLRVREPAAHVTGRLCVTSGLGPPSWWRASDVRSRDEGRWQWQRTRHPASDVLPSVTLGHSTRYIHIYYI
jgi:hypothetical protein